MYSYLQHARTEKDKPAAAPPQRKETAQMPLRSFYSPGRPAAETAGGAAPGRTGIPMQMKSRFESLSGFSFDDVRVHYHSGKPAQMQALAYTQGSDIYVAPGQERHLPHELGHVVQQKRGLVRATGSISGLPLNDDPGLERDADTYAARSAGVNAPPQSVHTSGVVQRTVKGTSKSAWIRDISVTGKKKEWCEALFDTVHTDDLIFQADEMIDYFDTEISPEDYSTLSHITVAQAYHAFKRFTAQRRDAEGAHGAERHGGSGDQFIVDRVNNPNEPNRASYLFIDDYLKWDTMLYKNRDCIFAKYLEYAADARDKVVWGDPPYNYHALASQAPQSGGHVRFNETAGAMLYAKVMRIDDADEEDAVYKMQVKADLTADSRITMSARAVQKPAHRNANSGDIQDVQEHPVAYTGGLSPYFYLDAGFNVTVNGEPSVEDLKWVTKY